MSYFKKTVVALITGVAFGTGAALGIAWEDAHPEQGTYCPTEDSCKLEYRGGYWYVTPQVP